VTQVPKSTNAEMEAAVASCKEAFQTWSKTTVLTRQQAMFKLQHLIRANMVSVNDDDDDKKYQSNLTKGGIAMASLPNFKFVQGGPKKLHKVNDTIILQPYIIESCGFQQNVPKEISYVTKVNI